jgi:hypothetical protein
MDLPTKLQASVSLYLKTNKTNTIIKNESSVESLESNINLSKKENKILPIEIYEAISWIVKNNNLNKIDSVIISNIKH